MKPQAREGERGSVLAPTGAAATASRAPRVLTDTRELTWQRKNTHSAPMGIPLWIGSQDDRLTVIGADYRHVVDAHTGWPVKTPRRSPSTVEACRQLHPSPPSPSPDPSPTDSSKPTGATQPTFTIRAWMPAQY
jgi:hypothetical protein